MWVCSATRARFDSQLLGTNRTDWALAVAKAEYDVFEGSNPQGLIWQALSQSARSRSRNNPEHCGTVFRPCSNNTGADSDNLLACRSRVTATLMKHPFQKSASSMFELQELLGSAESPALAHQSLRSFDSGLPASPTFRVSSTNLESIWKESRTKLEKQS